MEPALVEALAAKNEKADMKRFQRLQVALDSQMATCSLQQASKVERKQS